jgi:hypothetical protein
MDWLARELTNGLTKLMSLGLPWTPASDVIEITVGTWLESISVGRDWNQQRDASRIRQAFITLAATRDAWPQPKHFLDALPPSTQPRLTGPADVPSDSPWLRAVMTGQDPADVLGVQQDARQHDGRAAAAGPDA